MWIKQYRKHHWKHHNHLGTHEDTEVSYHNPINLGEIISGLTGIYILKILFKYFLYFSKKNDESNYLQNIFLFISSVSLMIVTQIIISFILYNFFSIFLAVSWLLGFFIFSPFLEKIRQTCEHRSFDSSKDIDYKKVEHGPVTRLFGDDFFSKYFGAAGFNKHLLHHIDPEVSYTRFKELEDFLVKSDLSNLILSNRSSYSKTFKSLYNK
jgi:fatty acid desaturase